MKNIKYHFITLLLSIFLFLSFFGECSGFYINDDGSGGINDDSNNELDPPIEEPEIPTRYPLEPQTYFNKWRGRIRNVPAYFLYYSPGLKKKVLKGKKIAEETGKKTATKAGELFRKIKQKLEEKEERDIFREIKKWAKKKEKKAGKSAEEEAKKVFERLRKIIEKKG